MKHLHHSESTFNHLNDAEYVKKLGHGGCGQIYLYRCKNKGICESEKICNKEFVVKKLLINEKHNLKNLLNEYTIGTLLHHEYIRKTYDIDLVDKLLIVEYCSGIDFFDFLMSDKFKHSFNDEFEYFKQTIDAIEYMHDIGIAHMDIKLENIMLDLNNHCIKLIDLGEARVFHNAFSNEIIKEKGIYGTVQYISPEEFTEKEYNPEKVDIWSLTIMLYELIFKTLPWEIANENDVRYKIFLKNTEQFLNKKCYIYNLLFDDNSVLKIKEILINGLNPNPTLRCNIKYIKENLKNIKPLILVK
jgi:protein-serine/threonine kinase